MCKTLESVVRLYHDARFYIHFMENITRTTQIFSYKGSEKTLRKDSKAKSYLKFKRLNNKKGQIFVNCPLQMNLIFFVKLFKEKFLYLCPVLYLILGFSPAVSCCTFWWKHSFTVTHHCCSICFIDIWIIKNEIFISAFKISYSISNGHKKTS